MSLFPSLRSKVEQLSDLAWCDVGEMLWLPTRRGFSSCSLPIGAVATQVLSVR